MNLDSLGSPTATSSPIQKTRSNTYTKKPQSDTPLRILVVNCIMGKRVFIARSCSFVDLVLYFFIGWEVIV
jgi:hypothetical protein